MAGVTNLLQRMTNRKSSGFNVWQNNENQILFREPKPIEPGNIARKDNNGISQDQTRHSYVAHLIPQPTSNNTNINNNNNGNNNNNHKNNKHVAKKTESLDGNTKVSSAQKTNIVIKGKGITNQQSTPSATENSIGNYIFGRTLGRGTFAKVKLAKHAPTGKEVAIKIIDKSQLTDSDLIKIYREIRIMKILNHPNIVRLYEVIETERYLHLVLEYVPKGEIFDFVVKNGRLHELEARKKFRQIISAIEYCHRKSIVHRDLKVENLLLDSQMGIKICDFGFSNEFSMNGKLNTFCGSPPYAAPELFLGKHYVGPEVDVWSLGVVLYTLLCGALPFDGRTVKELKERIMKGSYHIPTYLSQQSRDLIKKFLCVMPSKRITLQSALNENWLNYGLELSPLKPFIDQEELIDYKKIDYLVEHGYDNDKLIESVKGAKFDDLYATYKLTDIQKSELQTHTKLPDRSNSSFLKTPLRRSLRENNTASNNNSNNDHKQHLINNHSMRIPASQNHTSAMTYQSTNFGSQKSSTIHRVNAPSGGSRGSKEMSAILSKNGISIDKNSTLRNSFQSNQPVPYLIRSEQKITPTTNPNARYISRSEAQTSFSKKPKSHHHHHSVSMATRTPSTTSYQVIGPRRSAADLSTMNGGQFGSRSVSMKGSSTKLISSSKTSLAPRQSSMLSLNVETFNSSRAFSRPTSSKTDARTNPVKNNHSTKNLSTNQIAAQTEPVTKTKTSFGGWFKKKKS